LTGSVEVIFREARRLDRTCRLSVVAQPVRFKPPNCQLHIVTKMRLMGEAMISPDEFLRRCEQVRAVFAVQGRARQQLTRELAALCALTGARAESLCDHNSQLTGLRVSDPGGNLVISGPVDEVLAELVAMPAFYQNREPHLGARHRTPSPETAPRQADQLVAIPASHQNQEPHPGARHRTPSPETAPHQADQLVAMPASHQNREPHPGARPWTPSPETAPHQADRLVAGETVPDAVRLDLVGVDESGKARGRWTNRGRSRG
jgi:hypothetical protein